LASNAACAFIGEISEAVGNSEDEDKSKCTRGGK